MEINEMKQDIIKTEEPRYRSWAFIDKKLKIDELPITLRKKSKFRFTSEKKKKQDKPQMWGKFKEQCRTT